MTAPPPDPDKIFETLSAFRRSAALAAAIELDLFTHIGSGADTPSRLAKLLAAEPRGLRVLCDYLVVLGFLMKDDGSYELTPLSGEYLDQRSSGYLGGASRFLNGDFMQRCFASTSAAVIAGGSAVDGGTMAADHPIWVDFARGMAPLARVSAGLLADRLGERLDPPPRRVVDVAAGHGLYGIEVAKRFPDSQVVSMDWQSVLGVARENARVAGVEERMEWLAGDAFAVELPAEADLVLLNAFLHHFDQPSCVRFLRRVRQALSARGCVATLEIVPNEDRVSPAAAASFAFVMLATTRGGDAYVRSEWRAMFSEAGFGASEFVELAPGGEQSLILTSRQR